MLALHLAVTVLTLCAAAAPTERVLHVDVEGARLFVRVVGDAEDGPALLAIPGGPGLSHDYMSPLVSLPRAGLRVVTFDPRGTGASTGMPAKIGTAEQMASDIEAIRRAIRADRLHVLGHSFGAVTAMAYATRYPDRVGSLLFIDGVPPTRAGLGRAFKRLNERVARLQAQGVLPKQLPEVSGSDGSAWLSAILPVYFVKPDRMPAGSGAAVRFNVAVKDAVLAGLGEYDFGPSLASVRAPALVVVCDEPFTREMGSDVGRALPRRTTRTVTLAGCGHLPWAECPARLNKAIDPFLKSVVKQR